MRTFTINGKEIKAKPFSFNMICELEEMGINLEKANEKPLSMLRAYIGICMDMSKNDAGSVIESHLVNGGNFDEATKAMSEEMANSDFFQALNRPKIAPKKTTKA